MYDQYDFDIKHNPPKMLYLLLNSVMTQDFSPLLQMNFPVLFKYH